MTDIRYVPLEQERAKNYIFSAEVEREADGRWSAWIEALPGCATWGYTRKDALDALQEATHAYLAVLQDEGWIPLQLQTE